MYKIKPLTRVRKEIVIPPDKSLSHRAAIISSIAKGKTYIRPYLVSNDTLATLDCLKSCGVKVDLGSNYLSIEGKSLYFPKKREVNLCAKESGTTLRILSGLLCGQKFFTFFRAYSSLRKRPMIRVTIPLRMMGADIRGRLEGIEEYPPLKISPVKVLRGIKYRLPVSSAQVKSAILLASLYSQGETQIFEPFLSRDHTERMLSLFKADLARRGKLIISRGVKKLISPGEIFIPSDFSSASFFIVLGLILKESELLIKNVNINPTRCGLLKVLRRMGARIKIVNSKDYYEPYADILVRSSSLRATEVREEEVPSLIDEIPILSVAASFGKGESIIWGVKELKVKETDRLNALVYNFQRVGINIRAIRYGRDENWMMKIKGTEKIKPKSFKSFFDHRTAMSLIVLGKAMGEESFIDDIQCINKSFPQFIPLIESLGR